MVSLDDRRPTIRHRAERCRGLDDALDKDLTVTGDVVADIFISTTGSDGDLVVKLIDEYPNDDHGSNDARVSANDE